MGDMKSSVQSYRLTPKVDNEKLLSHFYITVIDDGKLSFSFHYWIPPSVKTKKGHILTLRPLTSLWKFVPETQSALTNTNASLFVPSFFA